MDPTLSAIDYDLSEGMADPVRAKAIMRILPQIVGQSVGTNYSGLPQTGEQALADVGALAGQAPSGLPGDVKMGTNLGDIYSKRAALSEASDRTRLWDENLRADRALRIMQMLGKGGAAKPMVVGRSLVDPSTGQVIYQEPKDDKTHAVAPGTVLVNDKGDVLFQAPDRADLQAVEGMVFDKRTGQYKDAGGNVLTPDDVTARVRELAQARSTKVSQNVNTREEAEEAKAVGKAQGENYVAIQQAGQQALTKIARLDRFLQLSEGVQTGRSAPALTEIQAWADSLGIKLDTKGLNQKQAMEALTNEMALQARNPAGGAGMPGALSDKDREFLVTMMPGLSRTPGGNRMLVETMKKLAQRDVEVARMARDYRRRSGKLDEGFYDELKSHSEANPLFDPTRDRVVTRRGTDKSGRRVVQYSDGSMGYE